MRDADVEESDSDLEDEGGGGGSEERLLTTPVGMARQRLGLTGAAIESHTPPLCGYSSTPDYKGGQTQ